MKLITAIINKKDASFVCDSLTQAGFFFTRLATSGGFLKEGNTTLLIGVEDKKVDEAIEVIHLHCKKRTVQTSVIAGADANMAGFNYGTAQITTGGATIFVTNIERFEKF